MCATIVKQKTFGGFMEVENIVEVKKVVLACNDLLTGKFLDLSKKLDKFMNAVTESDDVTNMLAESLENFDSKEEFLRAFSYDKKTGGSNIAIPTDDKKKMALIVTVFNDILNGSINVNQFLETYFQDKKLTPMQNFLEKIVKPFRDEICKMFSISTEVTLADIQNTMVEIKSKKAEKEVEVEEEKEELPGLDELLKEVSNDCNEMLALLKFEKKKTDNLDDLEFVLCATIEACEKKNLMVVNGLVIGISYTAKKFKSVKFLVNKLNDRMLDYYDSLGENKEEQNDDEDLSEEELETEKKE